MFCFSKYFVASTAVLVSILVAIPALAEEPDGARFRGGVSLEGGALTVPNVVNVGVAGVQGQLGAQINNFVGVYAVPSFDIVFGKVGGVNLSSAVLVDFTLGSVSIGVGPDVGVFAGIGGSSTSMSAAGGALYGGRLHLAWYPVLDKSENRARRKALAIGVDLRVLTGGTAFETVTRSSVSASADGSSFVLAPMATIGYQAF